MNILISSHTFDFPYSDHMVNLNELKNMPNTNSNSILQEV